jgi:acyl-CoA synthetase (NDP forming)
LREIDFNSVFAPRTVAVIGVSSTNMFHPGNIIFNRNYYGSECKTYAVNRKGGTLERLPLYPSVGDLPEKPDMAVVAVPAHAVGDVARECASAGVGSLVVISGGFAEMGAEGGRLQEELVAICHEAGIGLIGPNCFGIYAPPAVDTFFLPPERTVAPSRGHIAVASQSGAFLVDQIMTNFHEAGIGLSVAVSMGNKAMVDEDDLLRYFASREDTRLMCFYIEGIDIGVKRFIESAREITPSKPVVVFSGGKSERGKHAAKSHTAALAADHEIVEGALRQSGILEAEILSFYHHRPMHACNLAILSSSGGHGVVASDLASEAEINIPLFSEQRKKDLYDLLDPSIRDIASLSNPVDLTGSASDKDFEQSLDYLLSQPDIEAAFVLTLPYTPLMTSFVGTRLGQVTKRHDKPVVAYVPDLAKYGMVLEGFELNGIPVVHSLEEGVQMMKALRLLGESCRERNP